MKEKLKSESYIKGYEELGTVIKALQKYQHLCIYSAGNRAKEVMLMQRRGFLNIPTPDYFLVSEKQGNREFIDNPDTIMGIPVYSLQERTDTNDGQTAVLVVAMEHYHEEIRKSLAETSYQDIFYLTDIMEKILIAEYMEYYFQRNDLPFAMTEMYEKDWYVNEKGCPHNELMTYMVQCVQDVGLEDVLVHRKWITPLQAGAALTDQRIAAVTDMDGDNISLKNPYYNEMTGMYWLWKNTDLSFSGICHYRRQFESDVVIQYLIEDKADIVLPMPTAVYPDLQGYYLNWGEAEYYDMMLGVIRELEPEYYETAKWCAEHEVFIPNNIFIAKRDILEDYCRFSFRIIDEVEKRMNRTMGAKQKRCWESEHVSTIYFVKNMDKFRVVFSNLKRYW